MAFLTKLERLFGRFAIPGITLVLVIGQALVWFGLFRGVLAIDAFELRPAEVLLVRGAWWHLFSFLFMPPLVLEMSFGIIFMVIGWLVFYMMGTALEGFWGAFRFNLFLLVGYVLTVTTGFIYPYFPVSNIFLGGSVFLAFAHLNPDFEMMLFFILPVKIKWLALLAWLGYLYKIAFGPGPVRVQAAVIVVNFLLFFGHDLYLTIRYRGRKITQKTAAIARPADPVRHRCRVCNRTNISDPQLDFRYCSKCVGDQCYCSDHIFNHQHVTSETEAR